MDFENLAVAMGELDEDTVKEILEAVDSVEAANSAMEACQKGMDTVGKLFEEGGMVLLVGVAHNKNTYIHCIDEMLEIPDRLSEPMRVTVKRRSGEVVERSMREPHCSFTGDLSLRFPKYETAFRYMGAITDGFIGNAPTQLCDARVMKETVERIFKNSEGKDPLSDESAIPQKLYV